MSKLINLHGQRFGQLRVIDRGDTVSRREDGTVVYWVCRCDCGTIHSVRSADLRNGHTSSCGCSRFVNRVVRTPLRMPSPAA